MLDFSLTDEQEEIRRLAHSIALEQLRAQGRAAEKNGAILPNVLQTLAQTGLTTPFPEQYGGSGSIEAVTYALIAEELGFGDAGLALAAIGSMMAPLTVALAGDERQQADAIPPFCDQHSAASVRGSLAFAERTGGYTAAALLATARPAGQHIMLNGSKRDVIHGGSAQLRIVLARLPDTAGTDGLCALILPAQVDNVQISEDTHKLGLAAAPSTSFVCNDVPVPTTALLGEPGNSGVIRAVALYSILRAGIALGTARAAFEYASGYARERIAFGRPIVSYQGIAFMIAEMAMQLDAARLLLWYAASNWDRALAPADLLSDAEAAQRQALKIAQAATTDAVQIMGGAGFMQDHPVEMWMRNAAAME